ncbi:MAG: NUDIX hydrolase [Thermaurantimonas sp.]
MTLSPHWQDAFVHYLKTRPPLPGVKAHDLVSPKGRPRADEIDKLNIRPRLSAVAVVIERYQPSAYRIILIKRSEYAGVHSAQISFPGGQRDRDEVLLQTSLRELHEELGIRLSPSQLLTPLTELYIPPSNFLMYPFAFLCEDTNKCFPDPSEVSDVLYLPLQRLSEEQCFEYNEVTIRGFKTQVKGLMLQNNFIWGATSMVLAEIHYLVKAFTKTGF